MLALINQAQSQTLVFEAAPGFQVFWQAYLTEWEDGHEAPSACRFFSVLSDYVHESIVNHHAIPMPELFQLIERLVCEGDEDVRTAATTCFLENLQNQKTPPAVWVPHLGPASSQFCQAWDDYTGVETAGLWPEGMPARFRQDKRLNLDLNQAMSELFSLSPEFKLFWQQHSKVADQPDEPAKKAAYHLGLLARFVDQRIASDSRYQPHQLLERLEHFNVQGNDDLRLSVATGFTESLFQLKTPTERWLGLLGPSMRAYALAWAEVLNLNQNP